MAGEAIVAALALVALGAESVLLIRNAMVYSYRIRVLGLIRDRAMAAILAGEEWRPLYDRFESVSYWGMVLRFWRPLASFFDPDMRP